MRSLKDDQQILIDPEDADSLKRVLEHRRLAKIGFTVVILLLSPSLFFLLSDWYVAAGIAANIALFLFLWFVCPQD
jgi:hypothetical protein